MEVPRRLKVSKGEVEVGSLVLGCGFFMSTALDTLTEELIGQAVSFWLWPSMVEMKWEGDDGGKTFDCSYTSRLNVGTQVDLREDVFRRKQYG